MSQDFLEQAEQHFKLGELRLAIGCYRRALRFEKEPYVRARIYVQLTRIYRILVRMKNARLELLRAMNCLGLREPKNSFLSLLKSLLNAVLHGRNSLHPEKPISHMRRRHIELLAQIYEEFGLSAYYLRQKFSLLQSIVNSRQFCFELGDSRPLLNWYGGAACIFAILGLRKISLGLMKKSSLISDRLQTNAEMGKALIWEALVHDYLGNPKKSSELFSECIAKYGTELDCLDLRLASLTLSTNYFTRGHFIKARQALSFLQLNRTFNVPEQKGKVDEAVWYSLGPTVMSGDTSTIESILSQCRSILCVDKDEKWLLTKFLGHLLVANRKIKIEHFDTEDFINRFQLLQMKPEETHYESSFFWAAESYMRLDHAQADNKEVPSFRKSLKRLQRVPKHPTILSHLFFLKSALARIENNKRLEMKWRQHAFQVSTEIENLWVLEELKKNNGAKI